jgi:prepilin-type N-terminal cleavage/methylation domain-containing protein
MDGRARGATLTELLVVLGILSVLATASISMMDFTRSEAGQFNMIMMRTLALARRQAVGRGERVTLCASNDGSSCLRDWEGDVSILVFTDNNNDRQLDAGDVLHHSQHLALRRGRGFWRGSLGRPYMRFRMGGSAVDYGRYTYCPHSGERRYFRQLVVNHAGRAYQHHDGGGKRTDCEQP